MLCVLFWSENCISVSDKNPRPLGSSVGRKPGLKPCEQALKQVSSFDRAAGFPCSGETIAGKGIVICSAWLVS